jgi:mono/diheme cytochrome c family protein
MTRLALFVCLSMAFASGPLPAADPATPNARAAAKIFTDNCASCHTGTTAASDFSVATLDSVIAGGKKHGRSVIGGEPDQSPLIKILAGEIAPRMPMGKALLPAELATIREWIAEVPKQNNRALKQEWRWPYERPLKRDAPAVKNAGWVQNPVDAFILSKIESANITPAPRASKRTLARRLYFDLVGMPPPLEELNAFLRDDSDKAVERLVDKLLADSRYGERWGRHWLDLVRYAETSGLEGDGAIGNVWRYRDWVIDAFNSNMPYDRFVLLQIAGGDEHSKTRNNYQPDVQGAIPTAFLRVAPWDRSNLVAAEVRANYLAEVTTATSSVFLGLTVGCARCHDHKYDPIPQRDFYRFQAFFNAVQAAGQVAVPFKDPVWSKRAEEATKAIEDRLNNGPEKKAFEELEMELLTKLRKAKAEQAQGKDVTKADLRLEFKLSTPRVFSEPEHRRHAELLEEANRTGDLEEQNALDAFEKPALDKLRKAYAERRVNPDDRFEALTKAEVASEALAKYSGKSIFNLDEKNRYAELSGQIDILRRRLERWKPNVLAVTNVAGPPSGPDIAPTRVLIRGNYNQRGETVEPGFPTAFTGGKAQNAVLETDRYRQYPTRGQRITLARWIASPDNPLTARVMVNRIWQRHMGAGIVRTPSDFGVNGERPTHPELLDWLAVRFVESGWDIKAMHKLILLSNTYQQSSDNGKVDPENKLFSRFNRTRLEAEAIRDSVLFVSGRLNPQRGGPSVFPPLPDDLADFARYGRTGDLMWEPNQNEEDARRRSVYIFQRRSLPLPMMAAFDALPFSESCDRRSSTTTPLQALSLMNGNLLQEESEHITKRIEREVGQDLRARIDRAFNLILSRDPAANERDRFMSSGLTLAGISRVLLSSNEFLYVE